MHTRFISIAITLFFVCTPLSVSAQTPPSVNIPDHCTAFDIDNVSHAYATGQFLGICALVAAKEQGVVSGYKLAYDNSFGFYLQSLNGITPSSTQYWELSLNSGFSNDGLSSMVVAQDDVLSFQLTDWTNSSKIGSPVTFTVNLIASTPSTSASATGASNLTLHDPFDVPLALSYLAANQHADGSFDSSLTSDWAAIAFSSGGAGDAQKKMQALFASSTPELSSVTDYERHAMALEALGIDPYTGAGTDYIAPILRAFDGTQVGDPLLVNDDIFALFPLLHAGYATSDEVIGKTTSFILSKQKGDGSWEESVDLTAAAIQALAAVRSLSGVDAALQKAAGYLRTEQNEDGGWGNSFTTSWVLQAIQALGDSPYDWTKSVYQTPQYYLATFQERDGGVESTASDTATRVWATAYAVPAIAGRAWNDVLKSFPKPTPAASTTVVAASSLGRSPSAADEPAGPTGETTPKIDTTPATAPSSEDVAATPPTTVEPELAAEPETSQATPSILLQPLQEKPGPRMTASAADSPLPTATTSQIAAGQVAAAAAGANGFLNKVRASIIALLRIWL